MIPTVNLDDRTFDDIKNEAIRLIPRYCPEWTNHNESDPGITLIELFSWMTEMTLYRLNKVPAKTYLSMLELIGLSLTAPQSARAIIQFFPVENCNKNILIKSGTKVAAIESEKEPIIFETENSVTVRDTNIISCVNRNGENWSEVCSEGSDIHEFALFDTKNAVEHILYISSPILKYLSEGHGIQISFDSVNEITSVSDEIINHLYFEYWNGQQWQEIESLSSVSGIKKKDNVIYLKGPVDIQQCKIKDVDDLFIRAVLSDIPENYNTFFVKKITLKSIFFGEGFIPDLCISNSNGVYSVTDMNNSFMLFSENPSFNETFYISADEIFKNKNSLVKISFTFSETYVPEADNENALFAYEYWNGKDWIKLDGEKNNFTDGTFGFKQGGIVSFQIPKDISQVSINNEEHLWLRIRLITKDFAIGGNYVQNEKGTWEWHFGSRVQSPLLNKIRITYNAPVQLPQKLYSCSNFKWINLFDKTDKNKGELKLFDIEEDELPALYMGFNNKISEGAFSVYFRINEDGKAKKAKELDLEFLSLTKPKENDSRWVVLEWQCWNGEKWEKIEASDFTDSFHESGFINFIIPERLKAASFFNRQGFWLRCVKLNGSFEKVPVIKSIIINSVYAANQDTYKNEILGSANGAPNQICNVSHPHLLPGIKLSINENSIPSNNELKIMKEEGIDQPYKETDKGIWVTYKEVPNFYNSTSFSRHFVVDYATGKIMFGDGIHGINPPKGKFNIRADEYKVGGGEKGNIAAHKIQFMTQSIPYIAGCNNPFASEGGCDMETVDSLKSRAAGVFKSLNRAVTADDFQWLSREASSSVGRAYCPKKKTKNGEIRTIIIPEIDSGSTYETKLMPSRELIRRVRNYLDDRKVVGNKIVVSAPCYRDFSIKIMLEFKSNIFDFETEKQKIKENLILFFHSLVGSNGQGWEFGKSVTVGAILKQLEKINSILSVNETQVFDIDADVSVDELSLQDDELPYLSSVMIIEKGK